VSPGALAALAAGPARAELNSLRVDTVGGQLFLLQDLAPLLGAGGAEQLSLAVEVALPGLPSWQAAQGLPAGELERSLEALLGQQLAAAGLQVERCSGSLSGAGQAMGTCHLPGGRVLHAHLRLE
jgi:hypothetical protein